MSAILHSIIVESENDRISEMLRIWRLRKNTPSAATQVWRVSDLRNSILRINTEYWIEDRWRKVIDRNRKNVIAQLSNSYNYKARNCRSKLFVAGYTSDEREDMISYYGYVWGY